MQKYDVVIIGAGPAGGQCARKLSRQGFNVLLVEKAKDFLENNYSSGGAPLEVLSHFELPNSVVGTYWNTFRIKSTEAQAVWTNSSPFGPIIDFDKLRAFLAEETCKHGGSFHLGFQYQHHKVFSDRVEVYLKDLNSSTTFPVEASVIVDATGSERKVLAQKQDDKERSIIATGIEYHIEVDKEIYQKYSQSMNFFLGHYWMPQGYAWIFPMAPLRLKVGVIRYFQNKTYVPYDPSYKTYLQRILELCNSYQICDKHGKTIYYTEKQQDIRYQGPVIAIGDAISSINPLGWEGIRHAMASGDLAAQTIQDYLKGKTKDFSPYHKAMNHYFGYRWFFSEKLMSHLFTTKYDTWIDQSVRSFSLMDHEEIMEVVFHYKFRHTLKSFFWYFVLRFIHSKRKKHERTS